MLDHNALHSFVKVADTLSFSAAASQRNTVQSAVSAHIAKLEQTLDCRLIKRGRGRSVELTPEGTAFLAYARRILALSDEAEEAMRSAHGHSTIRIGTTVTLALSLLPRVLNHYAQRFEGLQIQILCDRSDSLLDALDHGTLDFAVMMDQGKRADRLFVQTVPLAWACAQDFALAQSAPVPLAFLTDGRDLRRYAFDALDTVGRAARIAHLSADPIGVRSFVEAGLALTVMPAVTVVEPLRIAPDDLALPSLSPIAFSAYGGHAPSTDAVQALADMLFQELGGDPSD